MSQEAVDNPEMWGCIADNTDFYRVDFQTREQARAALDGQAGAIVRCRRGFAREGLEYVFDIEQILTWLEERAETDGQMLGPFEGGLFNTDDVQEDDLRRRLAEALYGWVQSMNPHTYVITELEDIEATPNAQNDVP